MHINLHYEVLQLFSLKGIEFLSNSFTCCLSFLHALGLLLCWKFGWLQSWHSRSQRRRHLRKTIVVLLSILHLHTTIYWC